MWPTPRRWSARPRRSSAQLGPIDIWINVRHGDDLCAGAQDHADEYRRATEVTYLGYVYGTMAALRRMRPRNRGTIVQVGSALAYRAVPLQSPYCGAKFAIRGFTDSLRSELMHDGSDVHVTMVQMPALNTPQFDWARNKMPRRPQPVPPIFQPEVAAEAIVFAAYARRREVWVGGSTVKAIIGNKLAPGLLDRYLARSGYSGQLTPEPADRGGARTICSSRSPATMARMAASTGGRAAAAPRSGRCVTAACSSPASSVSWHDV